MTVADGLLADILAHPEDDTPRLILADWLDEHGEAERGEFIRVQCELAKPRYRQWCNGKAFTSGSPADLARQIEEYRYANEYLDRRLGIFGTSAIEVLPPGCAFVAHEFDKPCYRTARPTAISCRYCQFKEHEGELLTENYGLQWAMADLEGAGWFTSGQIVHPWTWRRGFIEAVSLPAADWLARADRVTAGVPIREVRLTTWPDWQLVRFRPDKGYNLHQLRDGGEVVSFEDDGGWTADDPPGGIVQRTTRRLFKADWPRITFTFPTF